MFSYALKGLWHYRRINVVVLVAVAISTAVIGGSLIVGDSVRYSLQRMTEQRLGQITHILQSPRFFRAELVSDISAVDRWKPEVGAEFTTAGIGAATAAPAILLTGSVETQGSAETSLRRAGSVTLLAVDAVGWSLLDHGGAVVPVEREIVLGYRTAQELQVQPGDEVSVWVEVPASIPRDSLLGERSEVTVEMVLTVSAVLAEDAGASRFDVNPGQQLPYNAFLPLNTVQERLGLEQVIPGRRNPVAKPARVNTALVGFPVDAAESAAVRTDSQKAQQAADLLALQIDGLDAALRESLTLKDVELNVRAVPERDVLSVESDRMILDEGTAAAVLEAAGNLDLNSTPVTVYLSNEIYAADRQTPDQRYSMYSIIAGLPYGTSAQLSAAELVDDMPVSELGARDILLSAWLAQDLQVAAGDNVVMKWHEVGSHGELPEVEQTFTVAGVLKDTDSITVDRSLTPFVEGVTDVEEFGDIRQPFEMDMARLTERDDDYWKERRATPKAFVSLQTAEQLWQSRYGVYTSIRLDPGESAAALSEDQRNDLVSRVETEIRERLNPARLGMMFRPVRQEGLAAAVGANDFTQLFIGFSFFLILSAIILASLMFRLGIQQRISQMGLLSAVGWPDQQIRRLFLTEGLLVCVGGSICGAIAAVAFAKLMIYGLTTWWIGAVGTQFLMLDIQPVKLVIAACVSLLLAMVVIVLALRSFRAVSLRDQLAGEAGAAERSAVGQTGRGAVMLKAMGVGSMVTAVVVPAAVVAGMVPDGEAFGGLTWQMVCFFVAGFACLVAGLYALSVLLKRRSGRETINVRSRGLSGLALANAARNPSRSMLTTALIAFATFVIVAVGAGRRNPLSETPDRNSGNGGFSLVAESAQPVLFDLNTASGRSQLTLTDQQAETLDAADVYAFAMKPGADASCVNLYQTRVPAILGASSRFLQRGGFRFADTPGENPWMQLEQDLPETQLEDGRSVPTIPVMGDMNTLMYSLKKGISKHILIPRQDDAQFALQVVGMLDGSVFQGVLLMTEDNLKRVDENVVGARYFLIETSQADSVSTALETGLNDFGLDAEPVSERLAGFLAVQNTYLSTFQMLGGLGLLVGTFGLAAVMMRNVVERRREIALMRAVGFTTARVSRLILSENSVLLFWGILLGTAAALLAMLPHLRSTGADLPWQPLLLTLLSVAFVGSLASVFAVRAATRLSIRENLAAG